MVESQQNTMELQEISTQKRRKKELRSKKSKKTTNKFRKGI